jgi:phage shock protein PspC (stress-responsive transcriptional regulator)
MFSQRPAPTRRGATRSGASGELRDESGCSPDVGALDDHDDTAVEISETVRRRLVRRVGRRLVAGVAGGLADATGTDPIWWRVAFVLLTALGGLGVPIYLLLWWVIPRADLPRSAGQRFAAHVPDAPSWIGVALLMFGAVLLVGQLGLWTPSVAWAFLLIGFGMVLYRREAERTGGEPAPADPETWEPTTPAELWSPPPTARATRPPGRPRERALLGWLSFGIALMAAGVLWALQDADSVDLSVAQVLGVPLAVLGVGLLVGSFVGRARWTILPALLLVPPTLVASLISVPLDGPWTNRYVTPRTAAEVATTYEQSGANLVFDFTKLEPGEHPAPIHAQMGIGEVLVIVPKGMPLTIHADVGIGSLTPLGGSETGGIGLEDTSRVEGADPLLMDVEVDIGTFETSWVADRSARAATPNPASPATRRNEG